MVSENIAQSLWFSFDFSMCWQFIKTKNEIMPFAATWMDLEIVALGEISQTKTSTM